MQARPSRFISLLAALAAVGSLGLPPAAARSPAPARGPVLPEIRLSGTARVPDCVTPARLMRHLLERTGDLDPRFRTIADYYKTHGEALRVRWDYAFFQMLLETNYLTFRRGDGRRGDVNPRQNNFAGIGATGGGAPGDSFPDVSTGVLAQMQHLVAYSGERVSRPVAVRTREKQDDIITQSMTLRRPVRFSDLTRRWAADRNYAASIEAVAERYRQAYCRDEPAVSAVSEPPRPPPIPPQHVAAAAPSRTAVAPPPAAAACDVWSASYGGSIALLIRAVDGATVNYMVLQVDAALEQPQTEAFVRKHAPTGRAIARFASREQALARAFELCPGPS